VALRDSLCVLASHQQTDRTVVLVTQRGLIRKIPLNVGLLVTTRTREVPQTAPVSEFPFTYSFSHSPTKPCNIKEWHNTKITEAGEKHLWCCPVQPKQSRLLRVASSWVLSLSKDGGSTVPAFTRPHRKEDFPMFKFNSL